MHLFDKRFIEVSPLGLRIVGSPDEPFIVEVAKERDTGLLRFILGQ